jgi:hypothetical protein
MGSKSKTKQRVQTLSAGIPTTSDRPDHTRATAAISIDGLSVLCASHDTSIPPRGAVEIAFLSKEHNLVEISVFDVHGRLRGRPFVCNPARRYRIEIKKSGSNLVGAAYRNSFDDEDFQWMPDLYAWHPQGLAIKATLNSSLMMQHSIQNN